MRIRDTSLTIESLPGEAIPPLNRARSFHARNGRLSRTKQRALTDLLPRWRADLATVRPRSPLLVEIGVGSGEAALHFALANPEWHVLGIEVHRSSLARFVLSLEEVCLEQMCGPPAQLSNVTIADRDAVEVLALLPTASVSEVRVFFPDPWPKRSQRHRRLIQQPFLVSVARVLRLGGLLRLATDDDEYARQMNAEVLDAGAFRVHSADRPDRPVTYYESQALAAGRTVRDLCAVRT